MTSDDDETEQREARFSDYKYSEKETGRLGASLEWRAQAVACGRGAEAEAPSRAATPHSHQLQRTTREEVDLINGTLYHGTALRAARPCGVSFQAVLARLPDLVSTRVRLLVPLCPLRRVGNGHHVNDDAGAGQVRQRRGLLGLVEQRPLWW